MLDGYWYKRYRYTLWGYSLIPGMATILAAKPGGGGPPKTGLALWLKADAGVTLTSGKVSTWADQSGNGNDATQGSGALRPTLNSSSIGGQQGITFAGGQFLQSTFTLGAAMQRIVVFKISSLPATNAFYSLMTNNSGSNTVSDLDLFNGGGYAPYTFANDYTFIAGGVGIADVIDTNPHVFEQSYNGGDNTDAASYSAALDGASKPIIASSALGRAGSNPSTIGARSDGTFAYVGDVCEVMDFTAVLGTDALAIVRTYLQAKYGIALGAP